MASSQPACGALARVALRERIYHHRRSLSSRVSPAFTLVELLVVISIIALLISILLPSLRSAREQAKLVKCMAHQRGLAQGGMAFSSDHNDRFQLVTNAVGVEEADGGQDRFAYGPDGELLAWPVAIAQGSGMSIQSNWQWGVRANSASEAIARKEFISEDFEAFICPADRAKLSTTFYPRGTGTGMLQGDGNPSTGVDDSVTGETSYWGRLSYGINEDIVGSNIGEGSAVSRYFRNPINGSIGWWRGELAPQNLAGKRLEGRLDRVFDPSTCLLIVDAGPNSESELLAGQVGIANQSDYVNLVTSAKVYAPGDLGAVASYWWNRVPSNRHPGGAVGVVFADFHAETVKPTEWTESTSAGRPVPKSYSGNVRVTPYQNLGNP